MRTANFDLCDAENQHCGSVKGSNLFQRLADLSQPPITFQLLTVNSSPLRNQGLGAGRKLALHQLTGVHGHYCLVLTIDGVEMRRAMIVVIHIDRDTVKV